MKISVLVVFDTSKQKWRHKFLEASLLNGIFMTVLINRNVIKTHIKRMILNMTTRTIHEHTLLVFTTWLQVLLLLPWTIQIQGISFEVSFWRYRIGGITHRTWTQNDFFWNRLFWWSSTIERWRRQLEKTLRMYINQSFITEEVQKFIVWFWVCLTGGLENYNYIWNFIKKMEINRKILKSLIIGSVRYHSDLTSYTGASQLYYGICTDNTLH